jgi:hypothetical protein
MNRSERVRRGLNGGARRRQPPMRNGAPSPVDSAVGGRAARVLQIGEVTGYAEAV